RVCSGGDVAVARRRGQPANAWAVAVHLSATGPYFGGTIRRAFAGGYRFRRKRGRTGTREPENYAGRPAIARSTRNLQHHARKHEFRDGRARGWIAAVHAGCARGDDQPGGGKISR